MMTYTTCPSCGASTFSEELKAKDFLVSGETFSIVSCRQCHLFFTQNVPDENSIGAYYQSENYISHSDTNKGIINRLYHLIRTFTLRGKRNLINKTAKLQGGNLLDIGSGTGSFLQVMQQSGWKVTGLEPNESARKIAADTHEIETYGPEHATQLPDHSVDVVTMWHVLEHVHRLDEQIRQIERLLADDGYLFVAVPNHTSWDAAHYGNYWAAWDVPRHLYHFSPESMRQLMETRGMEIVATRPMWFDSFYVSMLSEKYKTGKSGLIRSFITGLRSNMKSGKNHERCSSLIYIIKKKKS